MRDDLELRPLAKTLGWSEDYHWADKQHNRQALPHRTINFTKGGKTVWYCRLGWACAEQDKRGVYMNHRYRKSLKETFELES